MTAVRMMLVRLEMVGVGDGKAEVDKWWRKGECETVEAEQIRRRVVMEGRLEELQKMREEIMMKLSG